VRQFPEPRSGQEELLNSVLVRKIESTRPEYQKRLLQFSTMAHEILECFVPADYPNRVIGRYYGAIKRIIQVSLSCSHVLKVLMAVQLIEAGQRRNNISQRFQGHGTVWVIRDIDDIENLEHHNLRALSLPLEACLKCREYYPYKNEIDASNHLLEVHFASDRPASAADTKVWIKKHHVLADKRRCEQHMKVMRSTLLSLRVIHKGIREIHDGVSMVGMAHNPRYRLPRELVVAFSQLVLFLICTAHVIELITEHSESWTDRDWRPSGDLEIEDQRFNMDDIGRAVEEAVDQGKFDLTLMVRTQDYSKSITRYEAVGTHYILVMVLKNLQGGIEQESKDLMEEYRQYIARLVSSHPFQDQCNISLR
jgi:hypothetical protein